MCASNSTNREIIRVLPSVGRKDGLEDSQSIVLETHAEQIFGALIDTSGTEGGHGTRQAIYEAQHTPGVEVDAEVRYVVGELERKHGDSQYWNN